MLHVEKCGGTKMDELTDTSQAIQCAQQIEELNAKATEGLWEPNEYWFNCDPSEPDHHIKINGHIKQVFGKEDAELITQYRSLAPEAARHIRELEAENRELRKQIAQPVEGMDRPDWDVMSPIENMTVGKYRVVCDEEGRLAVSKVEE